MIFEDHHNFCKTMLPKINYKPLCRLGSFCEKVVSLTDNQISSMDSTLRTWEMENWTLAVVCPILVLLPVHNANKQNCSSHMHMTKDGCESHDGFFARD